MAPVTRLLSLAVVVTALQSCLAGPACSREHYGTSDVKRCKSKSKWVLPGSGNHMSFYRWGNVMEKNSNESSDNAVSKACGAVTTSKTSATQTGSATLPPVATSIISTSVPLSSSIPIIQPNSSSASTSTTKSATSTRSSSSNLPLTTRSPTSSAVPPPPAQTTATTSTRPAPVTTTKAPVQTPSPTNNPAGGSSGDKQTYLNAHNTERAKHGASALTWSDELAAKAQQWANRCVFKHSQGQLGPYGENLAAGTGDRYDIEAAIKSWTDEAKNYQPGHADHWTQVVWKSSKELGCAMAMCDGIFSSDFGKAKYFVCEYSPAGNVIGQFDKNVQV